MHRLIYLCLVTLLISACSEQVAEPVERVRPVKTILVTERASGEMREFPGTVEPVDNSSLSFEVPGLVQEIRVSVGDRFEGGQVLAVLDKQPFELNVESARAALSRAQAQFEEKETAYDRELRIQNQHAGATTQRAVDQALAAYESVRQNVSYSRAQLALALRDLEKRGVSVASLWPVPSMVRRRRPAICSTRRWPPSGFRNYSPTEARFEATHGPPHETGSGHRVGG